MQTKSKAVIETTVTTDFKFTRNELVEALLKASNFTGSYHRAELVVDEDLLIAELTLITETRVERDLEV